MMDYNPQNLQARMNEAGQNLQAELEKDTAVAQAKTHYEKAQAALAEAQAKKQALPYPGHTSKHRLSEWHAAVATVQSAKVLLAESEKAFRAAQNDAAAGLYTRKLEVERQAQRERRETQQAHHSMVEQELARSAAERHWLQAGGTQESFDAAWGDLWQAELTRRTLAAQEQSNRSVATRIRSAF